MKTTVRLLVATVLTLFPAMKLSAISKDSEGHVLVELWKQYGKAVDSDKPKSQLSVLKQIGEEAKTRHYAWDFYDAARKTVDVRAQINWKDRAVAQNDFRTAVMESGEPSVILAYNLDHAGNAETLRYINGNEDALRKSRNPGFYTGDGSLQGLVYSDVLAARLGNDYEYGLWALFSRGSGEVVPLMKDYFKGCYPFDALEEYSSLLRLGDAACRSGLEAYVKKYDGKAVSLLARQSLLQRSFSQLQSRKDTPQGEYLNLKNLCEKFNEDKSSFKGSEAEIAGCCHAVDDILETLGEKDIFLSAEKGVIKISTRNLPSVKVQVLKDKKCVWTKIIDNKVRSFFVMDRMTVDFPGTLDDGEYVVKCSNSSVSAETVYAKYTLSIAIKRDSEGPAVYVADYMSGEPVRNPSILLYDNSGKLVSETGVRITDGFCRLPSRFAEEMDGRKGWCELAAKVTGESGTVRSSRRTSVHRRYFSVEDETESAGVPGAMIIKDRAAFNPGETVHFKVILYEGRYEYKVRGEGTELTAVLLDPQDAEVGRKQLTVNEFGSASGDFELVRGGRGGIYTIEILDGGGHVARTELRVDEFVLPSFELTWNNPDRFYLPGEKVTVKGNVHGYSGRNLSGATLRYEVARYWNTLKEGEIAVGENGDFEIEFPADESDWSYYRITATVTDTTGETLEFGTYAYSCREIPLSIDLKNSATGRCDLVGNRSHATILGENTARIWIDVNGGGEHLNHPSLRLEYRVLQDRKVIAGGKAEPGSIVEASLAGCPSGQYDVVVEATAKSGGKTYSTERSLSLVKVADSDDVLNVDATCFFKEIQGDDIALQVGATAGPVWAVVELYDSGEVLLEHRMVHLDGTKGRPGSLVTIRYPYLDDFSNSVSLKVFWFRDADSMSYTRNVQHLSPKSVLPLEFSRFIDKARPGSACEFLIRTAPGVECAATVFDASTETIMDNGWHAVSPAYRRLPSVDYNVASGVNGSYSFAYAAYGNAATKAMPAGRMMLAESVAVEEEVYDDSAPAVGAAPDQETVAVRDNFAATVAWEPALRSDKDGMIALKFTAADRLSRYYVQLFAHDRTFRNATLRREMTVSLPVEVSAVEPQLLYEGDRYVVRVNLANNTDSRVQGRISVRLFDGDDYRASRQTGSKTSKVAVPAGGNIQFKADAGPLDGIGTLGILVEFKADDASASDGMFVTVPVNKPVQTITESHSSIVLAGENAGKIEKALRNEFVNVDGSAASARTVSIRQMLGEALPDNIEPESDNVLALTDALYARHLLAQLVGRKFDNAGLMEKILACRNSDGGFGWFEGMNSSPVVTAVVLERMSRIGRPGGSYEKSVRYLDLAQFGEKSRPEWCGGLEMTQYMFVRAMYSDVKFNPDGMDSATLKKFRENASGYLVPSGERGLNGRILAKARRLLTLRMLAASQSGASLAGAWGVNNLNRMTKSIEADTESLLEYAVAHKSGGCYYPNAVMPFRGLLESELYAHSLLCDLLAGVDTKASSTDYRAVLSRGVEGASAAEIADGIRLWIMIQKETQQWGSDPAYIQALNSVFNGSDAVLETKVVALTAMADKPFADIKASGNGFTIERKYFVGASGSDSWTEIREGDVLKVGDRVRADYRIWNEENRSFVRVSVPRPACLRPENQLSGRYGWWASPLRADGWYSFSPQGYRNVLGGCTEYWFDSYPEEKTCISEQFLVTQEGTFTAGVPVIESLYAPHYRANGAAGPLLSAR